MDSRRIIHEQNAHSTVGAGFGATVVTYEEVVKIEPQLDRPRPIMLVAPRGGPFNMDQLRARIVQTNAQKYGSPIPREGPMQHDV